jgi:hypothetical protein
MTPFTVIHFFFLSSFSLPPVEGMDTKGGGVIYTLFIFLVCPLEYPTLSCSFSLSLTAFQLLLILPSLIWFAFGTSEFKFSPHDRYLNYYLFLIPRSFTLAGFGFFFFYFFSLPLSYSFFCFFFSQFVFFL